MRIMRNIVSRSTNAAMCAALSRFRPMTGLDVQTFHAMTTPGPADTQLADAHPAEADLAAPALPSVLPALVSLADYESAAKARLSDANWAWLAGGGADELTLRWNREAFDRIRLQGRVLVDMKGAHTRLTLLGQALDYPVLIAPLSYQRIVDADGELACVAAASAMRCGMVVSNQASTTLEEIASHARGQTRADAASRGPTGESVEGPTDSEPPPLADSPLWFQLYVQNDRGFTRALVERAKAAGYRALVVTVDAPVHGMRNRADRAGFHVPVGIEPVNLKGMKAEVPRRGSLVDSPLFNGQLDAAATWADIEWLRGLSDLPLVVKGVTSAVDARHAADRGAAAIAVSNHGGRVLDTLPATIDALPRIADALAGRLPILLDGGIRRGTDVLKALALGASAVMVGRPVLHGLAVSGALGVAHVLAILRAELEVAMTLTGCPTLEHIDRSVLFDEAMSSASKR
ncbi:MAG: 2-hydroxy-acid oxidase [Rhizobacter sp.]|nr:2-hydroxy-acid oxidase [Rhizobacter sp.]